MSEPFLNSDDYDERAHQLYNEAQYDEAIDILREGLSLYPHAAELHVGMGYARLAREEYVWSRKAFEEAVALDADHEDALAGLGEALLKFGDRAGAVACFDRILALGFRDDHRSEEHTSELQSRLHLVCRLLLEKKKNNKHL